MSHAHAHSHGLVDPSIRRSRAGIRAVALSLAVLTATALAQTAIFVASDSIALLADLIHNFGDAATAIPLAAAFALRSPSQTRTAMTSVWATSGCRSPWSWRGCATTAERSAASTRCSCIATGSSSSRPAPASLSSAMARCARPGLHQGHQGRLTILVGPARESYEAAGAKIATMGELLGPRLMLKGTTSALRSGLRQTTTKGHAAQLGGVLIVAPDGSMPYVHLADDAGDNSPSEEVLAAARSAPSAASRTNP